MRHRGLTPVAHSVATFLVFAHYRDRAHVLVRHAAQVVCEPVLRVLDRALLGPAAQELVVHLEEHAQAWGGDRVPEALQPAVRLARYLPVQVEEAREDIVGRGPWGRDVQVLHRRELGDREAVVDLHHADLFARVLDARFVVCPCGGRARGEHARAVPVCEERLFARRDRYLQGLYLDEVLVRLDLRRDLGRRHDRARGAIAHATAVEQAERVGDHRRAHDLLDRDELAQVSARVLCAVLMALPRICAIASLIFSIGTSYFAEYAVASWANMPGAVALGPIIACCWPNAGESGSPP